MGVDQAAPRDPETSVAGGARLLVADDSAAMRMVVRITVETQGWTVLEATNGTEALTLARTERPDLVLLDLDFGDDGPDGLAVLTALRSDPAIAATRIVMLTASSDPTNEARANVLGVDLFLNKPFGPIDLIAALRRVLPTEPAAAPVGLHLVQTGALTAGQLQRALEEQDTREAPVPLGQLLVERRAISEPELARALEAQHERVTAAEHRRRVVIVDDHPAVRDGLRALLGGERRFTVVGDAGDASTGLDLARSEAPDLIVLDHEMPGVSGLDVLPALRAAAPAAHIVMYSMSPIGPQAAERGASAVVPKGDERLLIATLQRLADTQPEPVGPALAQGGAGRASIYRGPRRWPWREVAGVAIAVAAYAVGFLIVEPVAGASAAVLSVATVAAAGALLGPELGVIAAIATYVTTAALWAATGHGPGEAILQVGGNGLGAVMLLLLGAGLGAMRMVASRARRLEAMLGHALIGDLDPAAMLKVAITMFEAEAAVLFRLSADRSELGLIATAGISALPAVLPLGALAGAARAIRETRPVVTDGPDGLAVNVKAAVFIPVQTGPGLALLALLDERPGRFKRADPRVLAALGIAAARALQRVELASATQKRRHREAPPSLRTDR